MAEVFLNGQRAITVLAVPFPITSELYAQAVGSLVGSLNPDVDYGADHLPNFPSAEVSQRGRGDWRFPNTSKDVAFGATRPSRFPSTETALGGVNEAVGTGNLTAIPIRGDNQGKNVTYALNAQAPTGNSTDAVTGVRGVASRIVGTGNSNAAPVGADNLGKDVTYAPNSIGPVSNETLSVTFTPPVSYSY